MAVAAAAATAAAIAGQVERVVADKNLVLLQNLGRVSAAGAILIPVQFTEKRNNFKAFKTYESYSYGTLLKYYKNSPKSGSLRISLRLKKAHLAPITNLF